MSYKLGFLAGAAAGYVLGARAGRTAYEGIKQQSLKAWNSEPVQASLSDAAEAVKAKTPEMAHGLVDKAVSAVSTDDAATGTTTAGTHRAATSSTTAADAPKGPALS